MSLLTPRTPAEKINKIWSLRKASEEEKKAKGEYHIIPISAGGRISLVIFGIGLVMFIVGTIMGSGALKLAAPIAIIGMVIYFLGGFLRLQFD